MLNNGTTPPPSSNRTCGCPASGSRVNLHRAVTGQPLSQLHQPKALEVRIKALPAARSIRTLRAASQVLREARANIRIERTKGLPRITLSKVGSPATKVAIKRVKQLGQRHMALTMIREFMHSRARVSTPSSIPSGSDTVSPVPAGRDRIGTCTPGSPNFVPPL